MARVTGPLMSLSASGSLADTITFANWKGRDYVREYFVPANPNSATQVNVRTAWTLLVAKWQSLSAPEILGWDTYAEAFKMSGFNKFVSRGMDAYMDQLGSSTTPASVLISNDPPGETWTWA